MAAMSLPRLGMRLHGGLPPAACVALARAGEANGLASVWFAENPLERGALPALAACAAATQRIELGVGVWNPYLRHPAQIAMDIGALDELAGGRVALGIGSGLAAPIRHLGIDNRRPLGALTDCFTTVRALLAGETVGGVTLSYTARAGIPLLMAARGEQALRLCGRLADGLIVSNMCPSGFARHAAIVSRARRVVQYVPCSVGPDRARAVAAMKPVLAGLLRTFWGLAQRVPAARTSLVAYSGIPETDFTTGDPDARFLEAFTVTGDADDCRRRLAAYRDAGVTDLVLTFVGADPARDIAYLLRAAGA
jgi:5,10-methylenetetrahydromethanopterin reductase